MSETSAAPDRIEQGTPPAPATRSVDELRVAAIDAVTELLQMTAARQASPDAPGASSLDHAETIAGVLAGVAANLGGIAEVLAGRSGSWEAPLIADLLYGTLGGEEEALPRFRTRPIGLSCDPEFELDWRTDRQWSATWDAHHALLEDAVGLAHRAAVAQNAGEPVIVPEARRQRCAHTFGRYDQGTPESEEIRAILDDLRAEYEWLLAHAPEYADAVRAREEAVALQRAQEDDFAQAVLDAATAEFRRLGYTVPVVLTDDWNFDEIPRFRQMTDAIVKATPTPPGPPATTSAA